VRYDSDREDTAQEPRFASNAPRALSTMAPMIWEVTGGKSQGGILVRNGKDTTSQQEADRLSTSALIRELEVDGDRLRYERLLGSGPATGWVSVALANGNPLLTRRELPRTWEVVGGKAQGGILVRTGRDTTSPQEAERISTGALIKEIELEGDRLCFEKTSGTGPSTGWVSLSAKGNGLVKLTDRPPPTGSPNTSTFGPPLEIRMTNEDKDFSYEGLPLWVPRQAAAARLRRERLPYLPTPEPPLDRLSTISLSSFPPFKKLTPKKLKELHNQSLPGCVFGLAFPRTGEQMKSELFGAEWFTKAFHAAGTLPKDNQVAKVLRVYELPMTGYEKSGGAALKAIISVEYLKPDPELHTELFAKYSFDVENVPPGVITLGVDDAPEVLFAIFCHHLLPFPAPKFYYADVCRETAASLIITECIPYSKRGGPACKPYEILPACGKSQDFQLDNPVEYYYALFRAMGQMGAWDKLGRFDGYLGPNLEYSEEAFFANNKRPQVAKSALEATKMVVGQAVDVAIDFLMNWCINIAPPDVRDAVKLARVKEDLVEMSPYFKDMSNHYQANNSDWITANHANMQADNAFFWRDEYGEMFAGGLDWAGFSRAPFCVRFLGCISGAEADLLLGHIHGMMSCYVDEYARCGGPKLLAEDALYRFHLAFITSLFDQIGYVKRHTFEETSKEEMRSFTSVLDERFQERFYTRCGSLPMINAYTYYVKKNGFFKAAFDEWAQGVGKPYLTEYA